MCLIIVIYRTGVIPVLADILADAQKEKVSRIILAVFRVRNNNFRAQSSFFQITFIESDWKTRRDFND